MGPLLFTSLLAVAATAEPYPLANVRFEGNLVLDDTYYRSTLLEWGYGRQISLKPRIVAKRLQRHLRRKGYTLAVVRAQAHDSLVVFRVDEGRLAKVVFIGRGSVRTLQLQLLVSLPGDVFHRDTLEEQLEMVRLELEIDSRYEIIRTGREHEGMQFDDLLDTRPPRFELHIHLAHPSSNAGLRAHIHIGGTDGLKLGASYGDGSLMLDDDRWRIRLDVAGNRFIDPDGSGSTYGFSRGIVDARWYTPPFARKMMRSFFWLYSDFMVRQRPLEDIDFYRWVRTGLIGNISLEWRRGQMVALGFGGEQRSLVDIDQPADVLNPLDTFSQWRAVAVLQTDITFDARNRRRDRHHKLAAELRFLVDGDRKQQGVATWDYTLVTEFGWHDLWLRSRGAALVGDYQIMDEEPLKRHVRAAFGQVYGPRMASLSTEFRFSLWRDLVKVSTYLDGATYDPSRHGTDRARIRVALGAGIGINVLFLDFVQTDFYWGGGWLSNNTWDQGITLRLKKAY